MATTLAIPRPESGTPPGQSRLRRPRRRSVPHLLLGVLLVAACTIGAVVWSTTVGERRAALALARPVVLGQVLQPTDLREVAVAIDGGVDAISAEDAPSVIGQPVAASLPAGILLPRGALGTAPVPEPGRAVAAVALRPGQVTPNLAAGASVLVVLSADPNTGENPGSVRPGPVWSGLVWSGVVLGVAPGTAEGDRVVSIELAENDARSVAAVPVGRLSVVVVAGGDR